LSKPVLLNTLMGGQTDVAGSL